MKRYYIFLLISFMIVLYLFSFCGKRDKIVVTIGKKNNITIQDLRSYYKQKFNKDMDRVSYSELKSGLDQLIEDEIKIKAAYDMGLDKDSSLVEKIKEFRENAMLQKLHELEITDQIINELLIRDFYNKSSRVIEYQDLIIQGNNAQKPEEIQEKKKKAEMILQELTSDRSFEKVGDKYSSDPYVHIEEKKITYSRINDSFQNSIYSLKKGEVSDVIKKSKDFHIVKIKNILHKDTEPYEKKREEIQKKLFYQLRPQIQYKSQQYLNDLVEKANIIWNDENLDRLYSFLNNIKPENQVIGTVNDSLKNMPEDIKQSELFTSNDKSYTVQYVINKLSEYRPYTRFSVSEKKLIKNRILLFHKNDLIKEKAYSLNLDTHPEVKEKVQDFKRRLLIRELHKTGIFNTEDPTESEIYNYFSQHEDDKYSNFKDRNFDQIKHRIKRDLQMKRTDDIKNNWISEKKKEYNVKIFENVLKEIADEKNE